VALRRAWARARERPWRRASVLVGLALFDRIFLKIFE
jgi:hypothetical protein